MAEDSNGLFKALIWFKNYVLFSLQYDFVPLFWERFKSRDILHKHLHFWLCWKKIRLGNNKPNTLSKKKNSNIPLWLKLVLSEFSKVSILFPIIPNMRSGPRAELSSDEANFGTVEFLHEAHFTHCITFLIWG